MAGPTFVGKDIAYVNDADMTQHRVVIQGSDDNHIALPSGNDPAMPIGVSRDGNKAGHQENVRCGGREWVEVASGGATAGKRARVMNTGTVQDAATNATPATQTVIGWFRTSGASGELALVEVDPDIIVQ